MADRRDLNKRGNSWDAWEDVIVGGKLDVLTNKYSLFENPFSKPWNGWECGMRRSLSILSDIHYLVFFSAAVKFFP